MYLPDESCMGKKRQDPDIVERHRAHKPRTVEVPSSCRASQQALPVLAAPHLRLVRQQARRPFGAANPLSVMARRRVVPIPQGQ